MMVDGIFQPGFDCYGIPLGTDAYVREALWQKAEEVKRDMEQVTNILAKDSQALWVALHRSLAHKMDYHLSLCYPSDILPVAEYLDKILWKVFERAVGQQVPRKEEGLGIECVLNLPVDSMRSKSFQELSTRSPFALEALDCAPLPRQLLLLLLEELRKHWEEMRQSKTGGAHCWSPAQGRGTSTEPAGRSSRRRESRLPTSWARSWRAPWQLGQRWQQTVDQVEAAGRS